jgi:predicted Zn-dependent peptidase
MAKTKCFKKTVFSNGLTLLSERHPQYRSFSMGVWVKAGTRQEHGGEAGVSHFLEHMMFKGTDKRSSFDLAREVDQVGGEFNAFTGREYTCFHLLLLDRDAGLATDILSDVLLNSKFDADELERERKVILQEIAMVEESPEEFVHDLFFERVYGRHGLGRSILGTAHSIRKMRRSDLLGYFREYYRPEQLIISAAGDVAHDVLVRKLRSLTRGVWPGRKQNRRARALIPAPEFRVGRWWVQRSTEQVHLVWGVEGTRYTSKDRFAALLLNVYLGGGMSSVLFQEIREKRGLAYTVYSNLSPFHDSGLFTVYVATGMNQVSMCLRLMQEAFSKTCKELLPESELQTVKDNLKGTILLSADSVESRMSSIARNELYFGKAFTVEEVCDRIDEVTPEELRRVARRLFQSDKQSLLALGPRPSAAVRARFFD